MAAGNIFETSALTTITAAWLEDTGNFIILL